MQHDDDALAHCLPLAASRIGALEESNARAPGSAKPRAAKRTQSKPTQNLVLAQLAGKCALAERAPVTKRTHSTDSWQANGGLGHLPFPWRNLSSLSDKHWVCPRGPGVMVRAPRRKFWLHIGK